MNHWDSIRLKARQMRRVVLAETGGDASAQAMLRAVAKLTGIGSQGLPAKDPLLYKAVAVLHSGMVWFNEELDEWERIFNQIHEYAHHWQHQENFVCYRPDVDAEASEDAIAVGSQKVDGYGPHERRELEANVFAREFLLPGDELRKRFLAGENAAQIAATTGMPEGMVIHCLMRGILGIELEEIVQNQTEKIQAAKRKDDEQDEAATAGLKEFKENSRESVVLVDAGPGTGKTRTLIKRISHLTGERGINSSHILALTFSNKAAEEIYVRVRAETNRDMSNAWMGTFHKFGLDLIRRYYDKAGVSSNPKVIDALDARLLLEQNLGLLKLRHYRSLTNPNSSLKQILNAISRAKDALMSPGEFRRRAEQDYKNAEDKEEKKKAEKALETAYAYEVYENLLTDRNWLDYGDLLFRAVRLLNEHEDVREQQRKQYRHILVDEYQDVNIASRILLKRLADDGSGLWVVGDVRQAIYRFIGASPTNILLLTTEDFPDARVIKLNTNYRSQKPVVKVFAACAKAVNGDGVEEDWEVAREEAGADIKYFVSSDEKTEAADLTEEIKRLAAEGVEFRHQAVLCRRHDDLARLSVAMENAGIPVLYLGNFFERPEIRDLLTIVAITTASDGGALFRLANFKEYESDREDVKSLTDYVLGNQYRFPGALKRVAEVEGLSANGGAKLTLLAEHFKNFHPNSSAWNVLSQYLFVKSEYLRFLAAETSVRGKQKRLAIYQLLLLAHQLRDEFGEPEGGDPKRQFLDYVRHLRIVGEDKQLRQTPGWADDVNAVRLLTIHAAKGLEWSAVHLPTLSNGKFPASKQPDKSPLSKTKSPEKSENWEDEEENCLFFVALSRARDYLRLYRARQYDFREKHPSRLLKFIEGELPPAICKPPERVPPPARTVTEKRIVKVKREYVEHRLEIYRQCPLEYEYRYVLGINSQRSEMPMSKTRLCVYRVGEAIKAEQKANRAVTLEFAERKLMEEWSQTGPATHPYETEYRAEAEKMIKTIVERHPNNEARIFQPDWKVELENGIVIVRPDFVDLIEEDGKMTLVVEKLNFGSMPEKMPLEDLYALLDIAAEQTYPELKRQIKISYMTDGQSMVLPINSSWRKNSVKNYEKAIDGILDENFSPKIDKERCPFCSHYTMCSSNDEPIV